MLKSGKVTEVEHELTKYKVDIAAIQEFRWKGKGEKKRKNCTVFYSGEQKQQRHGYWICGNGKNE